MPPLRHGRRPTLRSAGATAVSPGSTPSPTRPARSSPHPTATMNGELIPVEAFYFSSTFGRTEASEDGFGPTSPTCGASTTIGARWRRWATTPLAGPASSPVTSWRPSCQASRRQQRRDHPMLGYRRRPRDHLLGRRDRRAFKTRDLRGLLGIKSIQVFNAGSPLPTTPPCDDPTGVPPSANAGPVFPRLSHD